MSYTPYTWTAGDVVTSARLNNIEQGIVGVESETTDLKSALNDTAFFSGNGNTYAEQDFALVKAGKSYKVQILSWDTSGVTVGSGYTLFYLGYKNNGTKVKTAEVITPATIASEYTMQVPANVVTPMLVIGGRVTNGKQGLIKVIDLESQEEFDALKEHVTNLESEIIAPSLNLADRSKFTENKYMTEAGATGSNSSYFYTDKIPVAQNDVIFLADYRYITAFNGDNVVNPSGISVSGGRFTVPSGIDGIIITGYSSVIDSFMVTRNAWLPYSPYSETIKGSALAIDNVGSIYGNSGVTQKAATLNVDTSLALSDYPPNLMLNDSMTVKCYFSSFSSVTFGYGYGEGTYFEVTSSAIKHIVAGNVIDTINHGLTISTYLMGVLRVDDEGQGSLTIDSTGGSFSTSISMAYGKNGAPFVRAAMNMTNVTIAAICATFKNALWLFGDSYCGLDTSRVLGQLKNIIGFNEILIDATPGLRTYYSATNGGYPDFLRCLNFGRPKYVIWALGMNDALEIYSAYVQRVIDICHAYGITIILVKPPTVPSVDNTGINAWIESSGERYIDWNAAVGASSSGVWYTGFLSPDNVHPSTIGAAALAAQTLLDAPELMQYD